MEILIIGTLILAAWTLKYFANKRSVNNGPNQKHVYSYAKKQFIMTKAENDFYHALQDAVGSNYMIYPQAHLDLFLNHQVKGQSWKGALSTIQRKSVDFLICSREYYNPLVAIELDDSSHNDDLRVERDSKVDAICEQAGMPLVRFKWQSSYESSNLLQQLAPYLK